MINGGFSCGNCGEGPYFSKQTMFTLEDVEHIIERILKISLPDALAKVKQAQSVQTPAWPCTDCLIMIPELLNMNKVSDH
jgi:hypothetical protein